MSATSEPRYPYVHVDVPTAAVDEVSAELWASGAQGVEERDLQTLNAPGGGSSATLVAFVPDEADARAVAESFEGRYPARVEFVVGDAWRDAWREHFVPSRVGARFLIRPTWEPAKTFPGEVELVVDPGRAFGSGIHETTRLCLREVDRRVREGDRVLDVGAGSGILSVAACLVGAASARALDIDPDTVPVVVENATRNGVADRILADTTDVAHIEGLFEVVLANIQARVLIPKAKEIADRVAPDGTLVLSGVLREQREEVAAAYVALGFELLLTSAEGEWVALTLLAPTPA